MAETPERIERALISVYNKTGLEPLVRTLHELGIALLSTGGTHAYIRGLGLPVSAVEDLTDYPSILGGRVKTLHPKVFGGILARREHSADQAEMKQYGIPAIDMVVVDLYPFEETLASGAGEAEVIEKIDIGGISLIRAAAKNFRDVLVVPAQRHYRKAQELLEAQNGTCTAEQRRRFASFAFAESAHYDRAILGWFNEYDVTNPLGLNIGGQPVHRLRYGENPHQPASFIGDLDGLFEQLNGKELSYNNLLDLDAATALIDDLEGLCQRADPPLVPFAILKHNNACGAALRPTLHAAWEAALAGDPVSAFGGILITTAKVDRPTAEAMHKLFFEVVCAPGYEPEALEILKQKKNRIILKRNDAGYPPRRVRSVLNGLLSQVPDQLVEHMEDLRTVTTGHATASELNDLIFANVLVKHTKSNAITLAKGQQLLASGTGQTSRVDALEQAIAKAGKFHFDLHGAVMASDAFFPFPDCVTIAAGAGITAVVQPGGSIKDQESIDTCNELGLAMCFTGNRHFKH